jgi:hypothetical protein
MSVGGCDDGRLDIGRADGGLTDEGGPETGRADEGAGALRPDGGEELGGRVVIGSSVSLSRVVAPRFVS